MHELIKLDPGAGAGKTWLYWVTSSEEFLSVWGMRYFALRTLGRWKGRGSLCHREGKGGREACNASHSPRITGQDRRPACCPGAGYRRQQEEKGLSKMR